MPVYEYECKKCHQVTEALQKFSDAPLTECPKCAGPLRKLISQSAFHLKGSGWYVTDYARKGESAPTGKKDKPSETTSQSSESSSESKANAPVPSSGTTETK
jgi:putative FmdB family regulatory protein